MWFHLKTHLMQKVCKCACIYFTELIFQCWSGLLPNGERSVIKISCQYSYCHLSGVCMDVWWVEAVLCLIHCIPLHTIKLMVNEMCEDWIGTEDYGMYWFIKKWSDRWHRLAACLIRVVCELKWVLPMMTSFATLDCLYDEMYIHQKFVWGRLFHSLVIVHVAFKTGDLLRSACNKNDDCSVWILWWRVVKLSNGPPIPPPPNLPIYMHMSVKFWVVKTKNFPPW